MSIVSSERAYQIALQARTAHQQFERYMAGKGELGDVGDMDNFALLARKDLVPDLAETVERLWPFVAAWGSNLCGVHGYDTGKDCLSLACRARKLLDEAEPKEANAARPA